MLMGTAIGTIMSKQFPSFPVICLLFNLNNL